MIPINPFNILLQVIAAFLIFVVGYLALLFSAIVCIFIAALIAKGARLLWSYMMRSAATLSVGCARYLSIPQYLKGLSRESRKSSSLESILRPGM
ncbi:MAG: hypothetical protein WB460_20235 [Candidatus Acidiferrales bacterium]